MYLSVDYGPKQAVIIRGAERRHSETSNGRIIARSASSDSGCPLPLSSSPVHRGEGVLASDGASLPSSHGSTTVHGNQAKKCLPTDIRYKKTRAMRRALTKHEASIKSAKQQVKSRI
ncbi:hypothetical protein PRIPAC_74591 [Pristionchus pacificus]|uniref:Large ribosomal subunit protein uL29 n=1 Tax=Pristionchus pacificus TaxID=54126 RepID=A0A2A6C6J7_PRIPA|nr:hypothetical protein PRIPAC_74591 [Pristionchus pacificus]|eukprot:PDM73805.1 hypothetical protein PRIPAC_41161 [Pristionchus pacificus]